MRTTYTTLIDVAELAEHLDDPAWTVLDCRFSLNDPEAGARDFASSRLPGARHVDLEHDLSAPVQPGLTGRHPLPDPDGLATRLAELGVGRDDQVVAYDAAAGPMAARLWWLMRWLGHEAVAVLNGGFAAWRTGRAGPSTPHCKPVDAPVGDFRRAAALVESVDIERVRAGKLRLLDARERVRFSGAHEPIDPVAGHIPGARNHPFADNLDDDGRFLPVETLRERFASSLGVEPGESDAPLVHYLRLGCHRRSQRAGDDPCRPGRRSAVRGLVQRMDHPSRGGTRRSRGGLIPPRP